MLAFLSDHLATTDGRRILHEKLLFLGRRIQARKTINPHVMRDVRGWSFQSVIV